MVLKGWKESRGSTFTVYERNFIYGEAVKYWQRYGPLHLCGIIYFLLDQQLTMQGRRIRYTDVWVQLDFPELYKQKPFWRKRNSYWWRQTKFGNRRRFLALLHAIARTQRELEVLESDPFQAQTETVNHRRIEITPDPIKRPW